MEGSTTRAPSDSRGTRSSLLHRLRDFDDAAAWTEFAAIYNGFVRRIARAGGMSEHDADDVAQDVLVHVTTSIHQFDTSRRTGAFRRWLIRIAQWRTEDQRRRNARRRIFEPGGAQDPGSIGDWLDQLPSSIQEPAAQLEAQCRLKLLRLALSRLQPKFKAVNLQIYDMYVLEGQKLTTVARFFGTDARNIYVVKNRITRALKHELESLRQELSCWEQF